MFQKILLRIMLICLGVAAVVGAMAIMLGAASQIGQVAGTLVLTAVSAGGLLIVTRNLHKPESRSAATLAACLIIIEFFLSLMVIWEVFQIKFSNVAPLEWIAAIAIAGSAAVASLRIWTIKIARVAGVVGLCVSLVVFILIGTGILYHSPSGWDWGLTMLQLGTAATVCLVGFRHDRRHWRWVGILCAVVAFEYYPNYSDHLANQIFAILASIAAWVAYTNIVLLFPGSAQSRWLAKGAVALAGLLAILIDYDVWSGASFDLLFLDPVQRLTAAVAVLTTCATLALLVMMRLHQKFGGPADRLSPLRELDTQLQCPVCNSKVLLARGIGTCAKCGLGFKLELQEPLCASCGYSLLYSTTPQCPECGTTTASPAPAAPLAV